MRRFLSDFFLLRSNTERAKERTSESTAPHLRLLALAEQDLDGAQLLFAAGHLYRARFLQFGARVTLDQLMTCYFAAPETQHEPPPDNGLDTEVTEAETAAFESAQSAAMALCRKLRRELRTVRELRIASALRVGAAVGIVLLAVFVGIRLYNKSLGLSATASATWENSYLYSPEAAIDGNTDSRWLLPNRTTGWLEIRSGQIRRLNRLRIVNAMNPPNYDRATTSFSVDVFRNQRNVGHFENVFGSGRGESKTFTVGQDATRVRITINGFSGEGGGITEVFWE